MKGLSIMIVAATLLATPATADWVCPNIGHACHYEPTQPVPKPAPHAPAQSLSDEQLLTLVATATMVQRAAKMCPQYEYDEAIFDQTVAKVRSLVGDRAVDQRIEMSNMIVEEMLARGLKSRFCDLEKDKVEEVENMMK